MRRPLALLVAVLAPGAAAIPTGGCSGAGNSADASTDGTYVVPGADATSGDAESDGAAAITTTMRLANMSPDLGPVDFCWRVTGAGTFTGPVLGGSPDGGSPPAFTDASADATPEEGSADARLALDATVDAQESDGASEESEESESESSQDDASLEAETGADVADAGDSSSGPDGNVARSDAGAPVQIAFGSIGPFVQLPVAGTLDLALVAPHQLSCGQPRFVGQVTLDPGKLATVAVMGLLEADAGAPSAVVVKAFTDEPAGSQVAEVRFINAALGWRGAPGATLPAPSLAVQVGGVLLAPEVDPSHVAAASTSPAIDALGYTSPPAIDSPAPVVLLARGDAAARTWTTPFFELGLLPGTSHTVFIVSLGAGALGVAWCGLTQFGELPPTCVLQPAR